MKAFATMLLLTICLPMSAQSNLQIVKKIFPFKEDKIIYSQTIDSIGKTKDELFRIAKKFMVENYRSANDVIQEESKEDGVIIGKGIFKIPHYFGLMQVVNVNVFHTIRIRVKDNKANIEIYGLRYEAYYAATQYSPATDVKMTFEDRFIYDRNLTKKDVQFLETCNKEILSNINQFVKAVKSAETDDDF